jgi:hypothetical protein
MAKPTLTLDANMARAADEAARRHRGMLPWYAKLPADARAEAEQIRAKWRAGQYGDLPQRHAARVIMDWGTANGLPMPKEWAIVRWLTAQD